MKKKIIHCLPFLGILVAYVAVRLPSLLTHSVAYTYDQGRDFIAGAQIILTHHIPFIGPTTGINGLFHGSWWYYYLTIPFLIFKGLPIGFFYANLFIHLASLIVLLWFIKKNTNYYIALFVGIFITFSPYFIFSSLFVGNNIMVLPVLLLFLVTNFYLFIKKNKKPFILFFLNGLLLGLVAEFELSFGLFIIPSYLIAHLIFPQLRNVIKNGKKIGLTFLGLAIAFVPRALFELKNHFEQTKILLSFITKPKLYNPKPFGDIFHDRLILFWGYWQGIFPNIYWCYFFSALLFLAVVFFFFNKKRIETYILFLGYMVCALFIFSLTYKDNFWGNYYEGIQYILVFILVFLFSELNAKIKHVKYLLLAILSLFFVTQFYSSFLVKKAPQKKDGLAIQEDAINVILQHESAQADFCVRIYTPPVIPHTYNYLFLYNKLKGRINTPSSEWINGTCWFIVEADSYKKRRDDWLKINEPNDKHTVTVTKMKDVEVRYYKVLTK